MDDFILPDKLKFSAKNLEDRLHLLHVPCRKVPLLEWGIIDPRHLKLVPAWIPTLLRDYSLFGGVLECLNWQGGDAFHCFSLYGPDYFEHELEDGGNYRVKQFLKRGMLPISSDYDGNYWLLESPETCLSPIYHYDQSADEYSFASSNIALLMACMQISDRSYKDVKTSSVMGYPE